VRRLATQRNFPLPALLVRLRHLHHDVYWICYNARRDSNEQPSPKPFMDTLLSQVARNELKWLERRLELFC
jgi:hypothetical protein